jgi:transcriptional regulator with XRE-family HTH domain
MRHYDVCWQSLLLNWQTARVDVDRALQDLGPRLRGFRQQAELTLAELAEVSGISPSTLSRLESGRRRPGLEHLLALAHVYGVPLEELLGPEAAHDPRVTLRPTRRSDRTVYPLTRRPGELQVFKTIIDGRTGGAEPELKVHEGYEWLYVLGGRLRMVLEDHDLVLAPGEAAEFDTRTPHWFGPADDQAVEFLSIFGKQGERMHVRARPARP